MSSSDRIEHTDSDEADLTRSCVRKRGYPTEAIARLGVTGIMRVNPHAQVRPYGCRHCGMWHVGGIPRGEQVYADVEPLESSFDAERERRRRGPKTTTRTRVFGGHVVRREVRARERHEKTYD